MQFPIVLVVFVLSSVLAAQQPVPPTGALFEKLCNVLLKMEGWRDSLKADAEDPQSPTAEKSAQLLPIAQKRVERLIESKGRCAFGKPVLHTDPNYTENSKPRNGQKPAACTTVPWLDRVLAVNNADQCQNFKPGLQDEEIVVFDQDMFDGQGPNVLLFPLYVCHEMWRLDQDVVTYKGTNELIDLAVAMGLPGETHLSVDQIKELINQHANTAIIHLADASFMEYLGETSPANSVARIAAPGFAEQLVKRAAPSIRVINRLVPQTAVPGVHPACPAPILPL